MPERRARIARASSPATVSEPAGSAYAAGDEKRRIGQAAAAAMRAAIRLAGGREVCFVCGLDENGTLRTARVVARGDARSVLALPGVAARGEMLVHNHPTGDLDPSDADLEIAARLHDDGVGFGIIDNVARHIYVVVEVPHERTVTMLDVATVEGALAPGGVISEALSPYEDRPSQRTMTRLIAKLYNGGGIALLEAGTGIGKSLAYLLHALRWAAANGERTIVSTNTINLQEQLVGKDLPLLAAALTDQPVRFALLKGWRNYLCLQRLEQAAGSGLGLFEEGQLAELGALRAWAEQTVDGSLSDLPTPPRPELWDEVAAEPDLCGRLKCPHYDRCFLFAARRRAAQADVIVVNHHLLLSDLAVRRVQGNWGDAAVLPAYRRLIVDEGHHLEQAASLHLGSSVSRRGVQRLLARLDRRGKGLLGVLVSRLGERKDLYSSASLELVQERLAPSVHAARAKGGLIFDLLDALLIENNAPVLRLTDEFAEHRIWGAGLELALNEFLQELELLEDGLRLVGERLELDETRQEGVAALLGEMRGVSRRLQGVGDALQLALHPPPPADGSRPAATVRWIEVRGRERNVAATSMPLDVAPILREDLWKRVESAVVTSATLTSGGRFEFLTSRLGLDEASVEPETRVLLSPFIFERQALLVVPADFPAPNAEPATHFASTVQALQALADASDGGIFALFTSHRDVKSAASQLRERGSGRRWPLLVHGEETRDLLLRRFRESGRAVLLGTTSFWEGVDVAGEALRGLLIAKLPFRVPSEPLTAAQCEAITARGGDAFVEYMLPHAALRLKQGFGRLIRSVTDRGVVVLCDSRVVHKAYGSELLESLPPARRVIGPWQEGLQALQTFYRGEHEA